LPFPMVTRLLPGEPTLKQTMSELGNPPVLALTATETAEVVADIRAQLGIPRAEVIATGIERDNIFFEVHRTVNEGAKMEHLSAILHDEPGTGIVYASTIKAAETIASKLESQGIDVGRYHGRLKAAERIEQQQRFMEGERRIMVATKAFGMGIDKRDTRFVVHWNFPDSVESYYQEAGRAGRDGQPAREALFYGLADRRWQSYFLGRTYPRPDEAWRLIEVLAALPAGQWLTAAELADKSSIGEKRAKVILAWLQSMGAIERSKGVFAKGREFASAADFGQFAEEHQHKVEEAHGRLRAMMRYGETTECRVQYLRRYFGEDGGDDWGHWDNCRDQPARRLEAA